MTAEKCTIEIDVHNMPPCGELCHFDTAHRDDASGIHQPVKPAVFAFNIDRSALPVGFDRDIDCHVNARFAGKVSADCSARGLLDCLHDGAANRARSPSDQNDFPAKINHDHVISGIQGTMSSIQPVCLITGASAGIGAALAHVFARHGHTLVLAARRKQELDALAAAIVSGWVRSVPTLLPSI